MVMNTRINTKFIVQIIPLEKPPVKEAVWKQNGSYLQELSRAFLAVPVVAGLVVLVFLQQQLFQVESMMLYLSQTSSGIWAATLSIWLSMARFAS